MVVDEFVTKSETRNTVMLYRQWGSLWCANFWLSMPYQHSCLLCIKTRILSGTSWSFTIKNLQNLCSQLLQPSVTKFVSQNDVLCLFSQFPLLLISSVWYTSLRSTYGQHAAKMADVVLSIDRPLVNVQPHGHSCLVRDCSITMTHWPPNKPNNTSARFYQRVHCLQQLCWLYFLSSWACFLILRLPRLPLVSWWWTMGTTLCLDSGRIPKRWPRNSTRFVRQPSHHNPKRHNGLGRWKRRNIFSIALADHPKWQHNHIVWAKVGDDDMPHVDFLLHRPIKIDTHPQGRPACPT